MRLLQRVDAWIFAPEDARRLVAVRIGLCSALALRLAVRDYPAVARVSAAHYRPTFYMHLFERMPSPEIAIALQLCGIVAALLAAAGLLFRTSLSVAILCSLVLNGMLNSAGRVIVGDSVLALCLLVLLACGTAAGRRARGRGARYGWPIRTMMIVVALAYFFAGFQKWRYSGISWVTSDNLRWILLGRAHPDDWAFFVANRPLLVHLFAAGALLLETCFPLVLFVPRLRWLFIPGALAMHVGVRLAIGLDYSAQWLTLLIVFVNWPVVVDWVRRSVGPIPLMRETG
jgi:hypothetical protein